MGDALRHLGWLRLVRILADELRIDFVRERVLDEAEVVEALLAGETVESIREEAEAGVVAALDRLPAFRPRLVQQAAQRRLDEVDGLAVAIAAEALHGDDRNARATLSQLEDLGDSLAIAASGSPLSVVELIGVAELCRATAAVASLLADAEERAASELASATDARAVEALGARVRGSSPQVDRLPELLRELDRAIDRNPRGSDEPRISSSASEALREARKQVRARRQALLAKAERQLRNAEFASCLRDGYWTERDGRVVFPIRSDSLGTVRRRGAIIHGSSGSGQTFFVEPGNLVEDNNAVREAELEAIEEERKVLLRLSARVAEHAESLARMQTACIELDLIAARLALGERLEAITPELTGGPEQAGSNPEAAPQAAIELRDARHPLMLLDGVDVVANDIVLARGHALVVSGPNAGGKTVALKTLGLCALMAAAGLRVPCRHARLPVFRRLITDVGDDQSITANLSTFSAHIGHVLEALRHARSDGPGTLVLLDEVAVGTDPDQGAALAEAILVELVDAGATVVVTTHYDRLKLLASSGGERFHNAAVGFDLARMRPTFQLTLGVPGSSSALAVAQRLGMPKAVLRRAEALLGEQGVQIDELLQAIEAERASLARTHERLEQAEQALRRRDSEIRTREQRVLDGVRSRRAKAYVVATEELHALERELKRRRREVRRARAAGVDELPTRGELSADARRTLSRHREAQQAEAEAERGPADRLPKPAAIAVGDRVRVLAMNQEGVVVALSGNPPKKVTVQLPLLRTTVKPGELAPVRPESATRKVKGSKGEPVFDFRASLEAQAARHFGDSPSPLETSADNTCDVRGERYADAQDRVADFVATALGRDCDVILIRHGHGGGALKKAVRECLTRLANVRKHRPGLPPEGGDAVTVAWVE